jgi:hypothetical protein
MGSDGGKFGSVNGTDMVAGDMSLNVGGNAGSGDSAGGVSSSGGGMGESLFLNKHYRTVLESFEIHKELNSLFFNIETGKMKEEVRHRLFKIAYLLIESMIENDIPLSISDILLIGSNAAYNYTEYSDLDLHILVDKSVVEDQELLTYLYNYIKTDFNNKYDISIYGHEVEVYLQGLDEENAAAGVYSILKDEWVKFPEQPEEERSITIEDKEIFKNWENRYNNLLDHEIDTFVQDLYKLRKSSLKSEGEFSDGNLVFKEFRNRGYLKDLKDRKNKIKSNELTLEGVMTESSMSRIYKKLTDESSCAIISTYRSERNDAENLKLLQELKQEVKSKYGFIEFISRWSEATDEGVIASDERSLLISNIELSEAMHLAKQYDQASFIYKDEDGCREICSNKFTSWDGVTYTPGDIVRYFNTKRDDKTILNLEDAREIFAKRKGGPASYLVKGGGQKAFHLDEVLEIENVRPSYFQKQPTYITILR